MHRQGKTPSPSQLNTFQNIAGSSAFSEHALPNEDWTQITDLTERRRVQNRIAQRNYRKKLKQRMGNMEKEERGTVESSISPKRQLPRDQALGCRSQYPSLPHSSGVMTTGVSVTTPGQPYDTQIYQCQQPYVPSATSESPSSEMVYAERHTYSQRCEQLSYYQAPSSYGSPITLGSHALGSVSPYQPGAMEHQPFMGESDALLDHGPGYFSTMGPGNPVTMPLLEQYVTQPSMPITSDYHYYDSTHAFGPDELEQYDPRNYRRS